MLSNLTNCCLEYSCVANCDEHLPLSLLLTMEHARIKLRNVLEASVKKKTLNLCHLAGIFFSWRLRSGVFSISGHFSKARAILL
jgi:hypothetical protein